MHGRDQARSERDALVAERNEAMEERLRALAERDAALGRGSGFPAVSAADLERQPHSRLPAMGRADPIVRAIAVGALIALLLVVLLLLKVA